MLDYVPWTNEEIETVRKMRADGSSFTEIETTLNYRHSRNACIGQAKRRGFESPIRLGTKCKAAPRRRKAKAPDIVRGVISNFVLPAVPVTAKRAEDREALNLGIAARAELDLAAVPTGVSFFDIKADACRWPLNDPSPITQFRFCGKATAGATYCTHHHPRAFAKSSQFIAQAAE